MGAIDQRIKLLVSRVDAEEKRGNRETDISLPFLRFAQTSVFSQLLPIKLGAYEKPLMAKVAGLRFKETLELRGF